MNKVKAPPGCLHTYKVPGAEPIYVDPEFKSLLDPLAPAELSQLEENLVRDERAIEPIVIWKQRRIILDGHHRIDICTVRKLRYTIVHLNFPDTDEGRTQALEWVIEHQTGRRNLSEEGKKKLIEWRRARVAAAHQAGESNRAIAGKENVSETTVRSDIQRTGAAIASPAKFMGVDGKQYPRSRNARAKRVGQTPAVSFVPPGERMPGDDTESEKRAKQEAKSDPKNGQVDYNWPAFNREFATFILNVDKLGKVYKRHNTPEATKLREDLLNWKNAFKKWGTAISKRTPTPDAVDRARAAKKPDAAKRRAGKK